MSSMFDFERQVDPTDARFRLAAAARLIIAELASSTATDDAFLAACQLVEQAASVLGERTHGRDYQSAEASLAERQLDFGPGDNFLDFSPFLGSLNPLAPPITAREVDGTIIGEVVYGDAYEGPPGCVHGGFIAGGFDEILGCTQSLSGQPGMTGRLQISYRVAHAARPAGAVRGTGRPHRGPQDLHDGDPAPRRRAVCRGRGLVHLDEARRVPAAHA